MTLLSRLLDYKIVAIIRGIEPDIILPVVQALYDGGIRAVEITLNTPHAYSMISTTVNAFNERMLIGAGTVLDPAGASMAIDAGAQFIISPSLDVETISCAKERGAISIPGAYTATEIVTAYKMGADIVKVFPASNPQYIKDLLAPLYPIPLMPTGGVNLQNIQEFAKAGAVAFGIGSSLVPSSLTKAALNTNDITEKARQFLQALQPKT
jgi:2-dehydro-3-deoxyphosphogluconate aldolase / (4S)-4-hydroxy-2-oxoglutarate aldolase